MSHEATVPLALRPTELRGVRLEVVAGPDTGKVVRAAGRTLRVGSAADNDMVLADQSVSRHHLELRLRKDQVRLVDLGSTNGTFLGELQVIEAIVTPGQELRIGNTTLRLVGDDAPLRVALSAKTKLGRLVGESVAMRETFALLERFAKSDVSVLIEGESGTGKELAAEVLHTLGPRAKGPFVIVDCASIPQHLFESELFGHTKGSFTGASDERRGLLEEADGGTVFFDEVGELPLEQQAKLLRALERREFRRVGTNKTRSFDARVVAATNRDLSSETNAGTFREDLFYRLAVARLAMPSLESRRDDIPVLVRHFVEQLDGGAKDRIPVLSRALSARRFPGNVRELRNAVQLALSMPEVGDDEVPPSGEPWMPGSELIDASRYFALPYADAVEAMVMDFQRVYLGHALTSEGGNVSAVARRAAMSRRYLQRVLGRLDLRRGDQEGGDDR